MAVTSLLNLCVRHQRLLKMVFFLTLFVRTLFVAEITRKQFATKLIAFAMGAVSPHDVSLHVNLSAQF
jgi:hypothetical protein